MSLYLSLHTQEGKDYSDELDYEGYHRIELNESNWKTVSSTEGYNTKKINFGRAKKADKRLAKYVCIGDGNDILMSMIIGGLNPYYVSVSEGCELTLPKKSI